MKPNRLLQIALTLLLSGLFLSAAQAEENKNEEQSLRFVSYNLCPFAQRVMVVLNHKHVPHTVEWIDLRNKPDWFLDINPDGQVPVLIAGDQVLTESQVINEFLDEQYPKPSMYPDDPSLKALYRVMAGKASTANSYLYRISRASSRDEARESIYELSDWLHKIESRMSQLPPFEGEMSLVDAAWAPFLMRVDIISRSQGIDLIDNFEQIKKWQSRVLALPAVRKSVVDNFEILYLSSLRNNESWLTPKKAMLPAPEKPISDPPLYCH
ncbi:glutathione S-transferase family protein [Spongorhabdus nitratireducens]